LNESRQYDSKAIAGAAYGFQYPDRGPLLNTEFSGGEKTVRTRLEQLGFSFTVMPMIEGS
jgi:putative restriction endonuclease